MFALNSQRTYKSKFKIKKFPPPTYIDKFFKNNVLYSKSSLTDRTKNSQNNEKGSQKSK